MTLRNPGKNPFFILAEKAMTRREITNLLEAEAYGYIERRGSSISRKGLIRYLHVWLNGYEFARFSRKKTVEQVAARTMRRRGFSDWGSRWR